MAEQSSSPRCPRCREPNRLTLTIDEAGTGAVALCRRCGAQVICEKRAGRWSVVVQGAAVAGAVPPVLGFLGIDTWADIVDWVQDTL